MSEKRKLVRVCDLDDSFEIPKESNVYNEGGYLDHLNTYSTNHSSKTNVTISSLDKSKSPKRKNHKSKKSKKKSEKKLKEETKGKKVSFKKDFVEIIEFLYEPAEEEEERFYKKEKTFRREKNTVCNCKII